jgi:hypothetical protein
VVRDGHLTIPDLLTIAEMLFPTDGGFVMVMNIALFI